MWVELEAADGTRVLLVDARHQAIVSLRVLFPGGQGGGNTTKQQHVILTALRGLQVRGEATYTKLCRVPDVDNTIGHATRNQTHGMGAAVLSDGAPV